MIIILLILLYFLYLIIKDYSTIHGYIKEKIIHFIFISYLLYTHGPSFNWIVEIIFRVEDFRRNFTTTGIISSNFNFYQSILYAILSSFIAIIVIRMINRNNYYRILLTKYLWFIIPSEIIYFYCGLKKSAPFLNDYLIIALGLIYSCIINFGIILIYRAKFMVGFFDVNKLK